MERRLQDMGRGIAVFALQAAAAFFVLWVTTQLPWMFGGIDGLVFGCLGYVAIGAVTRYFGGSLHGLVLAVSLTVFLVMSRNLATDLRDYAPPALMAIFKYLFVNAVLGALFALIPMIGWVGTNLVMRWSEIRRQVPPAAH